MVGQAWASLKLPELQFGKEKMNYMKESAHGCIAVYSMKAGEKLSLDAVPSFRSVAAVGLCDGSLCREHVVEERHFSW